MGIWVYMDEKVDGISRVDRLAKMCIADAIDEFNREHGYVILAYPKAIDVDGERYIWDEIDID